MYSLISFLHFSSYIHVVNRKLPHLISKLVPVTNDASLKLAEIRQEAESAQSEVKKHVAFN